LSSVLHQFPRELYSSDYWTVVNPWCLPTNTIQEQNVKVDIESRAEALDQRHCPGCAILERETGLVDQVAVMETVHYISTLYINTLK